ncbi:hypothetical protein L1766_07845 [Thermovorax subterraneus]|nr:hypothetical protein [Thermovorax subterraneus]
MTLKKGFIILKKKLVARPSMKLDEDIVKAVQKMDLMAVGCKMSKAQPFSDYINVRP